MYRNIHCLSDFQKVRCFEQVVKMNWIYSYRFYLAGAVCVCALAGLSYWGWSVYEQKQNEKAEVELYPLRQSLIEAEKKSGGELFDSRSWLQGKKADFKSLSTEVARYTDFLMSQKTARPAHLISVMELAVFLIQYEKKDMALSLLDFARMKSSSRSSWLYSVLLIQLGSLFMDKGNFTRAVDLFSEVLSLKSGEPFYQEVLLKTAVCYESMGELEKASDIYNEIHQNKNAGLYKERALHYDRLFQLKRKLKGEGK